MDLARRVYGRELKVAAMREIDSGRTISEVARQLELSPKLLERWRGEWRARGELCQGRSKFGPLRRSKSRPVGEGVAVFVGRLERSLRSPFRAAQA